jgi:hypothetical protein
MCPLLEEKDYETLEAKSAESAIESLEYGLPRTSYGLKPHSYPQSTTRPDPVLEALYRLHPNFTINPAARAVNGIPGENAPKRAP